MQLCCVKAVRGDNARPRVARVCRQFLEDKRIDTTD